MLYVTHVTEPRRQSTHNEPGLVNTLNSYIELVLTVVLVGVVFLGHPLARLAVPAFPPLWDPMRGVGAATMLAVVSLSTAYGSVFHGLFKDMDSLQGEVRRFELELQKYAALPSIDL